MAASLLLCVIVMLLVASRVKGNRRHAPLPPKDDPRWRSPSSGVQLIGRECSACNERLVFEREARQCKRCKAPLHRGACSKRHRALSHPAGGAVPYR